MINISQEKIMEKWTTKNSENPLLSIKCLVYNQEKFISRTLDGFLSQITDFPFEIVIHDDFSSDETVKVINDYSEKYPLIIKPILETENQYSKNDGSLAASVNPKLKGKYIAMCEGDDYWTDEYKLQKQVDFLESHPDYGLCYTKANVFYQKKNEMADFTIGSDNQTYENIFMHGVDIPTLTTCFSKELFNKYWNEVYPPDKKWLMGDLPMWLWFAKNSKVGFIPEVTSVYRVLENSASHSNDEARMKAFWQSTQDIRKFFAEKYDDQKLFEQYQEFQTYKKALEAKDLKTMRKSAKKIPFKYLSFKERVKNDLRENPVVYKSYKSLKKIIKGK